MNILYPFIKHGLMEPRQWALGYSREQYKVPPLLELTFQWVDKQHTSL